MPHVVYECAKSPRMPMKLAEPTTVSKRSTATRLKTESGRLAFPLQVIRLRYSILLIRPPIRCVLLVDGAESDSSPTATPSAPSAVSDTAGTPPAPRGSSPAPAATAAARASPRPQTVSLTVLWSILAVKRTHSRMYTCSSSVPEPPAQKHEQQTQRWCSAIVASESDGPMRK